MWTRTNCWWSNKVIELPKKKKKKRTQNVLDCGTSRPQGVVQFSSLAQLCPTLSDPRDCSTPGNSRNLHKLMSVESEMPSNHLILCRPLLLPSVFPSIKWISFKKKKKKIKWVRKLYLGLKTRESGALWWLPFRGIKSVRSQRGLVSERIIKKVNMHCM